MTIKKATLFASIGIGIILLQRILGLLSFCFGGAYAFYDDISGARWRYYFSLGGDVLSIAAWTLIGIFFVTLYKKQP